jgi:hypothetical protein
MSINVNISLFERVKRFIAATGRVNMGYWAGVQGDLQLPRLARQVSKRVPLVRR